MATLKSPVIWMSLTLLLAACASVQAPPANQPSPTPENPEIASPTATAAAGEDDLAWLVGQSREDAQGSVTLIVTANNINAQSDTIEFEVSMDTHSVDLSMDLAALSTLTTDTGRVATGKLWDAPLGGHHVAGKLLFPALVDGSPLLAGASQLTLTIRDLDAPERVFIWQR